MFPSVTFGRLGCSKKLSAAIAEALEPRRLLATITVTNTNDSGAGSLRQAILTANGNSNSDTIAFNISGSGVHTISPLSALPQVTQSLTIDGTTQSGYSSTPLIEIEGGSAGANAIGLDIFGTTATVKGLCINSFQGDGIRTIGGSGTTTIQKNFIGTDPTGMFARANLGIGVDFLSANGLIGGSNASDRNVISGNGTEAFGTGGNGVTLYGIGTTLRNNYIGVGADGTTPVGNANFGVFCTGGGNDERIIGNTIAYNGSVGVLIPNSHHGDEISQNNIYANGALGIDLEEAGSADLIDGVTTNDALDPDTGGNNAQNYPVLTAVAVLSGGTQLRLIGTLNSLQSKSFRVEFFASRDLQNADREEGARYVGQATVTTNSSGNATFDVTLSGSFSLNSSYTATATDTSLHNTSEFSEAIGAQNFSGTGNDDTVAVTASGGNYTVTINGNATTFSASATTVINIDAGAGADTVTIESGVDGCYVNGGSGNDNLSGGSGDDTLTGGSGANVISGGDGEDRLNGGASGDLISGGNGADRVYGFGSNDTLDGGNQVDRVYGGDGNDSVLGGGSNDYLYGEDGNDTLRGGNQNDILDGGANVDKLYGEDGSDTMYGGGGNDRLEGGLGNDSFRGGAGNDALFARDSVADILKGDGGTDSAQFDVLDTTRLSIEVTLA